MEHLRRDWSGFLEYAKNFITEPFIVIDVGCSGGIDEILKNFGDKIIYYGFDPNIKEIERLRKINTNPNINYIETFVYCGENKKNEPDHPHLSNIFESTSAAEGAKIIKDKIQSSHQDMVNNNLWTELSLSSKTTKISDFVKEKNLQYIDFIKSDIDGFDLSFFRNSGKIIDQLNVLSIVAEVSFACNINDEADLTNLLKQHGFALALLSTRHYSSKYLPDLYSLNIAAQSISGRIVQGDALYIKDQNFFQSLPAQKLLKFAIIMDLFNLTDVAAEIFNLYRNELEKTGINVEKSLDLMTEQRKFLGKVNYKEFIEKFYENHELFYPQNYSTKKLIDFFQEKLAKIGDGSFYRAIKLFQNLNLIEQAGSKKLRGKIKSKIFLWLKK